MHFYWTNWLWLIGFALVYCVGVNERENPKSHMEIVQSNIYYYERIKGYIVSTQELCLRKTYQDVPRKKWNECHKSKKWTGFPYFSVSRPNKMCVGARWRFWQFCMSNILPICLPYWECSTNSLWSSTKLDCIYLPINMALALFHKHLEQNRNIFARGIRKTVS